MGKAKKLRNIIFSPSAFSVQIMLAMIIGGLLAAFLMRPELAAGPVRIITYLTFSGSSALLARRYIGMVRRSPDGMATLLVVSSSWWWLAFSITALVILYLILAGAYNLWPHWGESLTERISYFFISGSAIGVLYKAITFESIPDEALIGRRVSGWPFTAFNGKSVAARKALVEHGNRQDDRDERQNERTKRQDERDARQDERTKNLDEQIKESERE